MKSILMIIPYFGKLPDYFSLWENSVMENPDVDFLIFTDISSIISKRNIKVVHISFDEFVEKFKNKFSFKIELKKPYKLCDFRPAYGYLFQEYIQEYDFWGHCDIDLIFGYIRHFITDDILDQYDKVLEHGHFCLYKNDIKINRLFMEDGIYPEINFKEVFLSGDARGFDEFHGMILKCKRLNVKVYQNTDIFFDSIVSKKEFMDAFNEGSKIPNIIKYSKGHLYKIGKNDTNTNVEIMYFHFQKRKISLERYRNNLDEFYIKPNEIVEMNTDINQLFTVRKKTLYSFSFVLRKRIDKLKKHYSRYIEMKQKKQINNIIEYAIDRNKMRKLYRDNLKLLLDNEKEKN